MVQPSPCLQAFPGHGASGSSGKSGHSPNIVAGSFEGCDPTLGSLFRSAPIYILDVCRHPALQRLGKPASSPKTFHRFFVLHT